MKESAKDAARRTLDGYLALNRHRRTPERDAILDAVFEMEGHFSLEELGERLDDARFRVSRATLYNTMKLFMQLRIVIQHRFQGRTLYETIGCGNGHCHQVCTICGRVSEISAPEVEHAVELLKTKRFHKDGFALYVYGICVPCQMKIRRIKHEEEKLQKQKLLKKFLPKDSGGKK